MTDVELSREEREALEDIAERDELRSADYAAAILEAVDANGGG